MHYVNMLVKFSIRYFILLNQPVPIVQFCFLLRRGYERIFHTPLRYMNTKIQYIIPSLFQQLLLLLQAKPGFIYLLSALC